MKENRKKYEQKITDLFLKMFGNILANSKYTASTPKINIISETPYESEFCSYVYDGNEIYDAVEFHIYRNGKTVASYEETEKWIRETLISIITS